MREFITAALPWVMIGLALAVTAVGYAREKNADKKVQNRFQLICMALGLICGAALSSAGLFEDHALGISLGTLWGLAIGTMIDPKEK